MIKKYLTFAVILFFYLGFSQDNKNDFSPNKLVEEIPSSPQASNLSSYGKFSANGYNGLANISIPIYNLPFEGLQFPLNLSYNPGGVRAAQDASWVGLNWNLSSYVAINRNINGADDLDDYLSRGGLPPSLVGLKPFKVDGFL